MEDWRAGTDLLRCNPSFHNRARHDVVLINTTNESELTLARLFSLIECSFDNKTCRTALVSVLKKSRWQPDTPWDRCIIREQTDQYRLVDPGIFIRGAHLIPIEVSGKGIFYCLNDLIDADWFLRAGN